MTLLWAGRGVVVTVLVFALLKGLCDMAAKH